MTANFSPPPRCPTGQRSALYSVPLASRRSAVSAAEKRDYEGVFLSCQIGGFERQQHRIHNPMWQNRRHTLQPSQTATPSQNYLHPAPTKKRVNCQALNYNTIFRERKLTCAGVSVQRENVRTRTVLCQVKKVRLMGMVWQG